MFSKPSPAELAERPLDRKGRKEAQSLLNGVKKFLRYNDDLISPDQKEKIAGKKSAFVSALASADAKRKDLSALAEELTDTCQKSVRDYKPNAWKENIEVIFVAVVIAMGIRAYFFQQFKIPTGSMQPTLNGIIAYPTKEMGAGLEYEAPAGYQKPALPQLLWDKFWYGRSHVSWVIKEDDVILLDQDHFYEKTHFVFFPRTYLITKNGNKFSAPGTESRILNLLNRNVVTNPQYIKAIPVTAGTKLAEGFVDTGDQLVVNKFIYHWVKPARNDVFVFTTTDINYIQSSLDPRQGSQHYIKRLAGTPGDTLTIEEPRLLINGVEATEPGFQKVMSREGLYTGYRNQGTTHVALPDHAYWALGDNSANSSDSRYWGIVPERNIVGRGAFVYYPFGHHFGPVR
jgi:signal peptidase I